MPLDAAIEAKSLDFAPINVSEKLSALHSGFESRMTQEYDGFLNMGLEATDAVTKWIGGDYAAEISALSSNIYDTAKQMYYGLDVNGNHTLGLKEISNWKVNENYVAQNMKQHAGYAAEVISTAKENLQAKADKTGITTYRADDLPDKFVRNDQYVDKVRMDAQGNIIERIQVKFVGSDGKSCLSKLASKDFDKYFSDGKVDKIEIPSEYYDDIRNNHLIEDKIDDLKQQLDRIKNLEAKQEAAQKIEKQIKRYEQIDEMIKKSSVSCEEALDAVNNPKEYTRKIFVKEVVSSSAEIGVKAGVEAAAITMAVSTVDNIQKVIAGEQTAEEAFVDVAKDTGVAGGIGFATGFVSNAVAQSMSASSHELIQSLGASGAPAAAIAFGVQSFDSVVDYAQGEITGQELAYELGDNAAKVAGGMAGAALAGAATGAAIGSVVPGAGTVVGAAAGFTASLVGGMVGTAVASEAYKTAVEVGSQGIDVLAEKAQDMVTKTVEIAKMDAPEAVDVIEAALSKYAKLNDLPFQTSGVLVTQVKPATVNYT